MGLGLLKAEWHRNSYMIEKNWRTFSTEFKNDINLIIRILSGCRVDHVIINKIKVSCIFFWEIAFPELFRTWNYFELFIVLTVSTFGISFEGYFLSWPFYSPLNWQITAYPNWYLSLWSSNLLSSSCLFPIADTNITLSSVTHCRVVSIIPRGSPAWLSGMSIYTHWLYAYLSL